MLRLMQAGPMVRIRLPPAGSHVRTRHDHAGRKRRLVGTRAARAVLGNPVIASEVPAGLVGQRPRDGTNPPE
jgi:hypothetical protein